MSKRRNVIVERSILAAAWDLFMEKGFQDTSSTDLAERSGVSRSLVQYYYPKKDLLAVAFGKAVVIASHLVARSELHQAINQVGSAYATGQVLLAALFLHEGARRFLLDALRDRDITQQLIIQNYQLAHRTFSVDKDSQSEIPDRVMMVAGGLGELAYAYLMRGETPEISSILLPSVLIQANAFGLVDEITPRAWQAELAPYALSNEVLAPLGIQALERARELLLEQPLG